MELLKILGVMYISWATHFNELMYGYRYDSNRYRKTQRIRGKLNNTFPKIPTMRPTLQRIQNSHGRPIQVQTISEQTKTKQLNFRQIRNIATRKIIKSREIPSDKLLTRAEAQTAHATRILVSSHHLPRPPKNS
jgi:hypothetical protein